MAHLQAGKALEQSGRADRWSHWTIFYLSPSHNLITESWCNTEHGSSAPTRGRSVVLLLPKAFEKLVASPRGAIKWFDEPSLWSSAEDMQLDLSLAERPSPKNQDSAIYCARDESRGPPAVRAGAAGDFSLQVRARRWWSQPCAAQICARFWRPEDSGARYLGGQAVLINQIWCAGGHQGVGEEVRPIGNSGTFHGSAGLVGGRNSCGARLGLEVGLTRPWVGMRLRLRRV